MKAFKKKILLFEPWHFGDLIIAVGIARELSKLDFEVSVLYDPKWDEWIRQHEFIDQFLPFNIPWTARNFSDKYSPKKYSTTFWKNIQALKKKVDPNILVDVRGDIRHRIFLRSLFPFKKIISLPHENKISVYQKGNELFKILRLSFARSTERIVAVEAEGKKPFVLFFFGANDFNREVPDDKVVQFLTLIQNFDIRLGLILKPGNEKQKWKELVREVDMPNLELIEGGLLHISNLVKKADIMISTDSGWLHLAKFFNKKVIGLYAFDTIRAWAPPGIVVLKAENCLSPTLKYRKNMQHIQPLSEFDLDRLKEELILQLGSRH